MKQLLSLFILLIITLPLTALPVAGAKKNSKLKNRTKKERKTLSEKMRRLIGQIDFLLQKFQKSHKIYKDQLLLKLGITSMKFDQTTELLNNKELLKKYHLKRTKSENFGDMIHYNGYHFKKLIKEYPESRYIDNARYHLIYIVEHTEFNGVDLGIELKKLEDFAKTYPGSDLIKTVNDRVKFLKALKKSGHSMIAD